MRPLFRAIVFAGLAGLPASAAQTHSTQQPTQPETKQAATQQTQTSGQQTTGRSTDPSTSQSSGQQQTGQWTSSTRRTDGQTADQRSAEQGERIQQELQRDLEQAGLSQEDAKRQATELSAQVQQLQRTYTRQLDEFQRVYARALAAGDMSQEQADQEARQLVEAIAGMNASQGMDSRSHQGDPSWNQGQRDGRPSGSTSGQELGRAEVMEISGVLREAGVDTEEIRKLEEQNFEQEAVREAVEQAHAGRGDASNEAREVARRVEELKWNAAQTSSSNQGTAREASAPVGGSTARTTGQTDSGTSSQTGGQAGQVDAETVLRQAGVGSSRIRELEEQGFPEQEVERSVERAQIELGRSTEEARQEARSVAQRVRMMRSGVDPRTDSFTAESTIRGQLERADVDSQKIQDLEAKGFPAAETRRAVMEAYEQRAQAVVAMIERMKSSNGGR